MNILSRIVRRGLTETRLYLPEHKNVPVLPDVTVSLTSYPARLPKLHLVIRSLLRQTVLPRQIILYLGNDTADKDIPLSLKNLQNDIFQIKTGYEDLKPHKKYFFVMQEFPDDVVVTVDDDMMYDKSMLSDLYESYKKNPVAVSARRVHLMTKKNDGAVSDYNDWIREYEKKIEPSHALFATGVGGVLYPPRILPAETFDSDAIKTLCLATDDVWLKFMELKNNVPVAWAHSDFRKDLTVRNTQSSALMRTNTSGENRNDINICAMQDITRINLSDFI